MQEGLEVVNLIGGPNMMIRYFCSDTGLKTAVLCRIGVRRVGDRNEAEVTGGTRWVYLPDSIGAHIFRFPIQTRTR